MSGSASSADGDMRQIVEWAKRLWQRLSARPGVAHLVRAALRFSDRLGNQFAAAITYFSFLSLVPILMVAFAIAGLVLRSSPDTLESLKGYVTDLIPSTDLAQSVGNTIDQAVGQSLTVGIIGLVIAAYSGLNWMGNVRDALRAQWRPAWERPSHGSDNFLLRYLWDLVTLAGLAIAILVSFALTAIGTAAQQLFMRWLNISAGTWVATAVKVGPFAVAIVAGTLTFAWVYTMLPDRSLRANRRDVIVGAVIMAVAFEILKAALTLLVARMSTSPSGVAFGSIIGVLLFFNLVARVFLMVGAWIATARAPDGPTAEST